MGFVGEIFQDEGQRIDQIVGEILATILFLFGEISQGLRQLEERSVRKTKLVSLPVLNNRTDVERVPLDLSTRSSRTLDRASGQRDRVEVPGGDV